MFSMRQQHEADFQPLPLSGALNDNLNPSLSHLKKLAKEVGKESGTAPMVYAYVMISSQLDQQDRLRQRGSGPNFAAGLITLTTCKHQLRAARDVADWPGAWIIGLSGRRIQGGRHWVCFATQIEQAFASHLELWKAVSTEVREAKAADASIHGDLFRPRRGTTAANAFDPDSYRAPIKGHRHEAPEKWGKDVSYRRWNRPAALLVGDPDRSFLWSEPSLFYRSDLAQGYKKFGNLSEFLENVEVVR